MNTLHQPGKSTPAARALLRGVARPIVGVCFRSSISGLENLPTGPFLLVANHSAGLGIAELTSFAALWAERCDDRPLAGFAHPVGFKVWPITAVHRALGSIPSTYEAAYAALDAGVPLLVFPGGDHETLRPIWQANRVDFGGRKGFLRIAAKTGVPIVPMGIRGSHFTAPILVRSRLLAWLLMLPRLLGVKRWAISVLSLVGAAVIASLRLGIGVRVLLCWAWLTSPLIFLPWVPWPIRFRIGTPISAAELLGPEPDDDTLRAALERVEAAIAALVHESR